MARRRRAGAVDHWKAGEIALWANNEHEVYRDQEAWAKNFARKQRKGTFKRHLAIKGLANNYVPRVVRNYNRRFGRDSQLGTVNRQTKLAAAAELLPGIMEHAEYNVRLNPHWADIRRGN